MNNQAKIQKLFRSLDRAKREKRGICDKRFGTFGGKYFAGCKLFFEREQCEYTNIHYEFGVLFHKKSKLAVVYVFENENSDKTIQQDTHDFLFQEVETAPSNLSEIVRSLLSNPTLTPLQWDQRIIVSPRGDQYPTLYTSFPELVLDGEGNRTQFGFTIQDLNRVVSWLQPGIQGKSISRFAAQARNGNAQMYLSEISFTYRTTQKQDWNPHLNGYREFTETFEILCSDSQALQQGKTFINDKYFTLIRKKGDNKVLSFYDEGHFRDYLQSRCAKLIVLQEHEIFVSRPIRYLSEDEARKLVDLYS